MKSSDSEAIRGDRRLLDALGILIAAFALVATSLCQAQSPVDPATVDRGHPTGHVHDHSNQTWPPQPPGLQNVVPLSDPVEEGRVAEAQQRRADALERIATARDDVRQALGTRFTRVTVVEGSDKSGARLPSRLVYYSYSKNSTVEVTVDGRQVRTVKAIPAAEYQPEITDAEITEAEGIARAHFTAQGQDRVTQLQAFGILAYQPTGKGFYAKRVLYISFHRDSDAPPEYVAWVDLTQQRVLRSRQEGQ